MTNHIIEKIENRNRPMPEVFTRNDIRNTGGWDVDRARAVRGEPFITVSMAKKLEEIFKESLIMEFIWENKIDYKIDEDLEERDKEKVSFSKLIRKYISKKIRNFLRKSKKLR